MAQKQAWSLESWQWDPYKLVATPAAEQPGLQQKKEAGSDSPSSPTSSGDHTAKAVGRSRGPPTCQVEGCVTDLSGLKEYHNRYKICEYHLKIPSIVREGARHRFCQQCGRFHDLGEFDGDKRSCRARLQRHNARRRKKGDCEPVKAPKKASTSKHIKEQSQAASSRSGSPMSDDAKTSSASPQPDRPFDQAPQLNPWQHTDLADVQSHDWSACAPSTNSVLETAFTDFLKEENAQAMQSTMPTSSFLADGEHPPILTQQMVMEDLLADCPTSDAAPGADGMDMQYMPDTLYPPATHSAFKPAHQPNSLPQGSMPHSDHGTSPMLLMHQQALQAARDRGYANGLQQQQQPRPPLSSWNRPPEMVPQSMDVGVDDFPSMHFSAPSDFGPGGRRLLSQPQQAPPHQQLKPKIEPVDEKSSSKAAAPTAQSSPVLDQARDLLALNHSQPQYIPEEQFTRMSAKLFNCTPDHLPHDLKQNLIGLLSCCVNSIEGYIMPGCLHLTVEALVDNQQLEALQHRSARQAVELLLRGQNKAFWGSEAMLVQWGDELVLVKDGTVQHVVSGASSTGLLPEIHSVTPACVSSTRVGQVSISGMNIAGEGRTVLCRSQGLYVPVTVTQGSGTAVSDLRQEVHMQLPAGLSRGSVQVEVARGGFISHSKPVLILENEDAVAEVLQLSSMPIPGSQASDILRDMGRVLEFSNSKQATVTDGQQPARHDGTQERSIVATLHRLLAFACQVGWVAVSDLLLAIASPLGASASELVADLEGVADHGLTLLHHAVRSRNASLVGLVLTWGINNGYEWDYAAAGPAGLTPLHLAALLDDGGKVADELTDACAGALTGWSSVKAADGSTAADLAAQSGGHSINAMIQRKLEGQASGLQDQFFQFDPETGEWLDQDSDSVMATPAPYVTSPSLDKTSSGTIPSPGLNNSSSIHVNLQALRANDELQQLITEPRDKSRGLASHGSSQVVVDSKSDDPDADDALCTGLHERSSVKSKVNGMHNDDDDDQLYLQQKVYGSKRTPKVFDSRAALRSSAVVGLVGVVALGVRHCLESYGA